MIRSTFILNFKTILICFVLYFFSSTSFAGDDKKLSNDKDNTQHISGVILDRFNEPLSGVKITVAGINGEFYSDFDGKFTIGNIAKNNTYELKLCLTSFVSKTLKVSSRNSKIEAKLFPH